MSFRCMTQGLLLGIGGDLMCFGFAVRLDIDSLPPKEPVDPEGTYAYIYLNNVEFNIFSGYYLSNTNYWGLSQNMWCQWDCLDNVLIALCHGLYCLASVLRVGPLGHHHLQPSGSSHYQMPCTRASHCLVITVVRMFKMKINDHLEILLEQCHCLDAFRVWISW